MNVGFIIFIISTLQFLTCAKSIQNYTIRKPGQKHDNPAFVKDRFKQVIIKPEMPERWINQHRIPFHPAWMDHCDPYHCNDYHKVVCGLNRASMRFKWFQSGCHMILNNKCSHFRGFLKYDIVENKFCTAYVMFARSRLCPAQCEDDSLTPLCGISVIDRHIVLFKNKCAMEKANCRLYSLNEYEVLETKLCYAYVKYLPDTVSFLRQGSCPSTCDDESAAQICAMSITDNSFHTFKNKCAMEKANCNPKNKYDYVEAIMGACILEDLKKLIQT